MSFSHYCIELDIIHRYKYTLRVPQLVWPVSWHQSVSPCQTRRDRTTTEPAWRPWSEHAGAEKSFISLSGNLEQPNARLAGETALKCHRAQNGKNNLVNKRRQPVQVQHCKCLNKWSLFVTFTLSCTTVSYMILLTDATVVAFVQDSTGFLATIDPRIWKMFFLYIYENPF